SITGLPPPKFNQTPIASRSQLFRPSSGTNLRRLQMTERSVAALACAMSLLGGCNDDHVAGTVIQSDLGGGVVAAGDGSVSTNGDMASGAARVRVAHLSTDKGPFDVCVAPKGTGNFMGPLLKPLGVPMEGLAYSQVSQYFSLSSGAYDLRVVNGTDTT